MQNITAPASEAANIYLAYKNMNLLDIPFNFVIPVYTNMPESRSDIYSMSSNDFVKDATKVYANVSGNLNVRSGPGTGYSTIAKVSSNEIMTRIYKGIQAGERWDKIRLSNFVEGYVFASYISEYQYIKVRDVSIICEKTEMTIGETQQITANVLPYEAKYKEVRWSSSDESILGVDDVGNVVALKAGEAVITAITEDQNKTASISIKVRNKNPSISFDKTEYNLIKGAECPYNLTISDSENSIYDIQIEDSNVIKIEDGKIVALNEGTAMIYASIRGTAITTVAKVTVIDIGENEVKIDDSINIKGDNMSGISPGETADNIKKKVFTNLNLEITNAAGNVLEDAVKIGTGSKVILKDNDENEIYSYNIVIYGDMSGDGVIDSLDILKLRQHLMGSNILRDSFYEAANVSKDDTNVVDSLDILMLRQHLLGIRNIEQ